MSRFFALLFVAMVTLSLSHTPAHADSTIVYVDEVYYPVPTLVEKTDINGTVSFKTLGSACPTQGENKLMAKTFGGVATDWTYAEGAWTFESPTHTTLTIWFGAFDTYDVVNFANASRKDVFTKVGRWRCTSGLLELTRFR